MGRFSRLGNALYEGTTSVDFVGRWKTWYAMSAVLVAVAIAGLVGPGLNMGIEFEGGVEYRVALPRDEVNDESVTKIRDAVDGTGIENATNPIVNTSGTDAIRVQTQPLTLNQAERVSQVIRETAGVGTDDVSQQAIGATWGAQVLERAVLGLVVFLVLVVLFIWAYFREWKMSVAAIVALAHDVVITVGVYALSGFEVTPATVTGLLTILGFSLYDTVVVFDKVRENVDMAPRRRWSYARAANLAVNQTLVRSINTSIVALLPVGAILYVGVFTLGSGALKDLALSLFVGMAAGAYSSIFIATPLLVQLKRREKDVALAERRAELRRKRQADRYASVPAFTEDMPVRDEDDAPGPYDGGGAGLEPDEEAGSETPRPSTDAMGAGRVVPRDKRPVQQSAAAKRSQPTRRSREARGKRR